MDDSERLRAATVIDSISAGGRRVVDGTPRLGIGPDTTGIEQPKWFPTILTGPGCLAIAALEAAGYEIIPPKS